MFIDLGIWSTLVYLTEIQSPWLYVGFLSIAFFFGVLSGLVMSATYQAATMNRLLGLVIKKKGPLDDVLNILEGNSSMNMNMMSSVISGLMTTIPSSDHTDNLGLPIKRRKNTKI